MSDSPQPVIASDNPGIRRGEVSMVLAITLVGTVLRWAFLDNIAVEHFDEGVYSSNLWVPDLGHQYPQWHLYAPPLMPWLTEWSIIATRVLFGRPELGAPLVSLLAGCLTIPLVWYVGRKWFGATAGLVCATLCSLSDVHILYSRTALTDVLLCFWMLIAVYLIWKTATSRSLIWPIAAGAATAGAWWTKYNGWLPLAIGVSGFAAFYFYQRMVKSDFRRSEFLATLGKLVLIVIVAIAIWSPAYFEIDAAGRNQQGGYREVNENHRKYVVGLSGWPRSFAGQMMNHRILDGWISAAGVGLIALVGCCSIASDDNRFTWNATSSRMRRVAVIGLTLTIVAALLSSGLVIGVLAAVALSFRIRSFNLQADAKSPMMATWLCAAWFVGLSLATPLYTPYPRLVLPWFLVSWLCVGAGVGAIAPSLFQAEATDPGNESTKSRLGGFVMMGTLALLIFVSLLIKTPHVHGWESRNGLQRVTEQILNRANKNADREGVIGRQGIRFIIYVYGEPAVFFHLSNADALTQPTSNLDFVHPDAPKRLLTTYLVVGPRTYDTEEFQESLQHYRDQFQLIGSFKYTPSTLVSLNERFSPRKPNADAIRLYRVIEQPD